MTTTINANTTAGLVYSADTSGIIKVQSNGVATNALAWVNFNGTGTVAIRSAYNVSSITDNGTGDYMLNFTTALSDANYAAVATSARFTQTAQGTHSTTQLNITCQNLAGNQNDVDTVQVAVFGN
jgi:hypothetical protein